MPIFEYKSIDLNVLPRRQDDIDVLNAAGAEGWELISISAINVALLKRTFTAPLGHDEAQAHTASPDTTVVLRQELDALARSSGFSLGDILDDAPSERKPVPVKYRDPNNPENTWSGRGRMPRWLTAAIEDGAAKKEDFLI